MKCLCRSVIVSFSEAFEWELNRTQHAAQEYVEDRNISIS